MNIATNIAPWGAFVPATPADLVIPPEATFIEPTAADDDAPTSAVGNVFAALMPDAVRAAVPAANDDIAGDDESELSTEVSSTRGKPRGDENRTLRKIVGPRLTRARALSGYSQTEAAKRFGYRTPAQLSLWEMGRRMIPIFEIIKAANLYGVSIDYLLGETHEPDRDPSAGTRHAILRGVRGMLSKMAELTAGEIDRHVRLIGPHAGNTRSLLESGDALLDAFGAFVRHNHGAFVNMRGGASLQRLSSEFEAALAEARVAIRLHDARDADLARALAALGEADPLTADDEA